MFSDESFPASQADSSAPESEFASPFLDEELFAHLDGETASPFQQSFASPFEMSFDPESEELAAESAFENLQPPESGQPAQPLQEMLNELTNLVFFSRHPELKGRKIEPNEKGLAKEWLEIRDRSVQPALKQEWPENKLADLVFFARHPSLKSKPVNSIAPKYGREWMHVRSQLVRPVLVAQAPAPQPQAAPMNRGPVNSRRVYVVSTTTFQALPAATRAAAEAEVKAIFAFQVQGQKAITVILIDPNRFPVGLNFSDAVVSLIDYETSSHLNDALRMQRRNIEHSIRALGFSLPQGGLVSSRIAGVPERIGQAAGNKHIATAGTLRLAIPLMVSAVAVDEVISETITEFSQGKEAKEIQQRRKAPVFKSARYWASHQALIDTRKLMDIDTVTANPKDPGKWVKEAQELLGKAVGRALAHEARHLYVKDHADTGLGAGEAQLLGSKTFERFSAQDQKDILDAITDLEKQQGNATVVETFPAARRSQGFPY